MRLPRSTLALLSNCVSNRESGCYVLICTATGPKSVDANCGEAPCKGWLQRWIMNSGTMPAYGNAGPFPSQSALLPMHPDDQMFLDVFAQDLGHTSVNGQSLDALPPLDFGNPGSPAVEFLQARSCFTQAVLPSRTVFTPVEHAFRPSGCCCCFLSEPTIGGLRGNAIGASNPVPDRTAEPLYIIGRLHCCQTPADPSHSRPESKHWLSAVAKADSASGCSRQDFDDGVDTAFKSYAAQLDGLASGLPNSQPLLVRLPLTPANF